MKRLPIVAALIGILTLTGCAAAAPSAEPGPGGGAASDPSAPQASPSPTKAHRPDPVASCGAIDLKVGTTTGAALGACFSDSLHALGTYRAKVDMAGKVQEAEVRLRPDVAIHARVAGADGFEIIFVGGTAYQRDGSGWITGDPESDDISQASVGAAGQLLAVTFSGDVLRTSVAACPVWKVRPGTETTSLPSDLIVDARVFECAAPYSLAGSKISESRLLFEQDWTPVGVSSTATGYGETVHSTQWYYDFGTDFDISAPV